MQNRMVECSVCHSKLLSPASKAVSRAYDRHRSDVSSKTKVLNILLVVGDCVLVGLQVLGSSLSAMLILFQCKRQWEEIIMNAY